MDGNDSRKDDLLFYILAAVAFTWNLVCIAGLLMRTS